MKHCVNDSSVATISVHGSSRIISDQTVSIKKIRLGKGSNILPVVRKLLTDQENWKKISNKCDYHFLGTFPEPSKQQLYYIPDCTLLQQASTSDHHYNIWNDIQLSKGNMNKDRLIEVEIGESKEHVFYRSAPCQGVKMCPENGCSYVAPIREKRGCKTHTQQKLIRSEECPVELVYIYPQNFKKYNRRWIGGIVRNQKDMTKNLHNHKLHRAFKICNLVKDKISNAVQSNLSLTPTDISQGSGIGFIPSAVDTASSHLGRVAREIAKTKRALGVNTRDWSPCSLEAAVDDIDREDLQKSDDSMLEAQYKEHGRPYLVSAGVENGMA